VPECSGVCAGEYRRQASLARAAAVVAGVAAAGRVAIGSAADPILAGVPGGLRAPRVAVGFLLWRGYLVA